MDNDTRDYFFELLKSCTPESKGYILNRLFGYLEGLAFNGDSEGLEFLMRAVQTHSDIDHGIK
jgi:hypothetical protein